MMETLTNVNFDQLLDAMVLNIYFSATRTNGQQMEKFKWNPIREYSIES